jgi:hypothetical protein
MHQWHHIKVSRLDWFCHRSPERWRWRLQVKPGENRLEIVMPSGRRLDFKINGGCWVRKQFESKKQT